jgi:Cdc6-like AAA superfamily ATPase
MRSMVKIEKREMTEEDWLALRQEIIETFTPGTPINEVELFAGRRDRIQQLQDTVLEPGRHAVIHGERGVGKSSIANTFYRPLHQPTRLIQAVRINCDAADTFDSLWRKVFKRIARTTLDGHEIWADEAHKNKITPDDVVAELSSFNLQQCPIIVIDEFDRVQEDECRNLVADTVKTLSDFTVNCTVVLVGVAKNVTALIANHASVSRALVQVPMRRMTREELEDVVSVRLKRMGMSIEDDALWRITFFSAGLPFYTHSLGKYSALLAVANRRTKIAESDVFGAMESCLADVDHSIRESYTRATERIYRKPNLFTQVLAACALTDVDSLGQFTPTSVEAPLSAILGTETKSSAFGFHLNELTKAERGSVFEKAGERRYYKLSFKEPLMQPYIIMKCLHDQIVSREVLEKFAINRQRGLSI